MKKIIGAIAIIALAVIVGIGAGYYFTHQNSGSPQNANTTSSTATISEAEAQQIALEDAGLAEADVSFTKTKLDRDDGRQQYEIEFIASADNAKYDYEIDAQSGAILSVDREQGRDSNAQQNTTTSPQTADEITADEAKAIALQHAGVAEADALYIDIDYDRDDGVNEWSVDFATQDTEYDYEIAAADGSIMKSEREPDRP